MCSDNLLGVAVVGAGYWGPNLIRNFQTSGPWDVLWVCDLSLERARRVVGPRGTAGITDSLDDVLDDPMVDAVAIATPATTHTEIALSCLEAGKNVLIEKPLAASVAEGEKLVRRAADLGLVLMCDHTFCHTPPVTKLRALMRDGTIGKLQYFDSVRINLGLVQSDVDVFWDLAPHDLSILDFILPDGLRPRSIAAQAADPIGTGRACIGYLTLFFDDGVIGHIHVNWLSPTKIRTTVIGGSRQIVVWDDTNPAQRLTMYDRGVDVQAAHTYEERLDRLVSYRIGDMVAPALPSVEGLQLVVKDLAEAIVSVRPPLTDGQAGLRVLRVLEAIPRSLARQGAAVALETGDWS